MSMKRSDLSTLGRWWWVIDKPMFFAFTVLICIGAIIVTASSPAVANRIGLDSWFFVSRQFVFLFLSFFIIIFTSFLNATQLKILGAVVFVSMIALMIVLPFMGAEIKGATRWVNLFGLTLQPSELLKPAFILVNAMVLSAKLKNPKFPHFKISLILYAGIIALLVAQPDFGMVAIFTTVFASQLFIAGLPYIWILAIIALAVIGSFLAYSNFTHVKYRIDKFMNAENFDNYQTDKALEAFDSGGLFGRGPGNGVVKNYIPDSHTDYVFAVIGEEFGIITCLIILCIFAFLVFRSMYNAWMQKELFNIITLAGIAIMLGAQSVVNMGVSINMLPAKGMTLPFISYGGSSMMAVAFSCGIILALTKKQYGKS